MKNMLHLISPLLLILFLFPMLTQAQLYWEDSFSSSNWKRNYDMSSSSNIRHITNGGPGGNGCVEITIKKGSHHGGSAKYLLKQKLGFEPEELYAEYKVRYDDDMREYGGKGPGFSGTYDKAGWGNRPGYGRAGWSARGSVNCDNQPYAKNSWYVYHTYTNYDAGNCPGSTNYRSCNPFPYTSSNPGRQPHASTKTWGSTLKWGNKGDMQFNRWYSVKQYIKLNTPGRNNGILRVWVNGSLAQEFTDINFRRTSDLKIFAYWFNYYNGGPNTIRETGHVQIDDFKLYGPQGAGGGNGGGGGGGSSDSYTIASVKSRKWVSPINGTAANGAAIVNHREKNGDARLWKFVDKGDGYTEIKNVRSGKCIAVPGGNGDNGAKLVQWDCKGYQDQHWKRIDTGNGQFQFKNRKTGKCLDLARGNTGHNVQFHQWSCNSSNQNQLFWILNSSANTRLKLDKEKENELMIYPSPSDKELIVEGLKENVARISILDLRGRTVMEQQVPTETSGITLNLDQLKAGVYLLKAGNSTRRFMKK